MNKQEVIEAIQMTNRGAKPEFLFTFDERALEMYLRRLDTVHGHRGRGSVWVREPGTRAVSSRADFRR